MTGPGRSRPRRTPQAIPASGEGASGEGALAAVLASARACTLCARHLPLGPRPVLRAAVSARLLVVGQAPGTRVHESGVPWDDRSGDRLRHWLGLERALFYDESRIAMVPMGFCYPGRDARGGDHKPRPECAPLWHPRIVPNLPEIRLALLVGRYAQAYYLGERARATMAETVASWRDYLPRFLPLPHPSWRTTGWLERNPWFEAEVVPALRLKVRALLDWIEIASGRIDLTRES